MNLNNQCKEHYTFLSQLLKTVRRLEKGAASVVGGLDSSGNETILRKCEVESERQSEMAGEYSSEDDSFLSYDEEEYAKDAYCSSASVTNIS